EYILENNQIEVVSFGSAKTFLMAATEINPDLYLLDIMLPDGNGIDLCRRLKTDEATRMTPVILMSAHYRPIRAECEADDFLEKPFDVDSFLYRIEQQMV